MECNRNSNNRKLVKSSLKEKGGSFHSVQKVEKNCNFVANKSSKKTVLDLTEKSQAAFFMYMHSHYVTLRRWC